MKYQFEYTDTFAGEANYSWVQRGTVEAFSLKSAIRKVKAELGLTGVHCKRHEYGETVELVPRGELTVVSISPDYGEEP